MTMQRCPELVRQPDTGCKNEGMACAHNASVPSYSNGKQLPLLRHELALRDIVGALPPIERGSHSTLAATLAARNAANASIDVYPTATCIEDV
jgi:hypothetical protein